MNPFAALWLEEGFELVWLQYGRIYDYDGYRHFAIRGVHLEQLIPGLPKSYRRPGAFMSLKDG